MFIGENLLNLRIMNGYSRKQLAEMIKVSEQAVWQYENDYTSPKLHSLNELKTIFNVKAPYFFNEDILTRYATKEKIPLMNIAYRSSTMNFISKTQTEARHLAYLQAFIEYTTKDLSIPTHPIIDLRNKCIDYLNNTDDSRFEQINCVAKMARHSLQLDEYSNENLLFSVEKSGIFVFEKAIGENIDAYSLWTEDDYAFIILGNLKRSAVRRNFDIAHELGHLLLHYKMEFTQLDKAEHRQIENEADLFAGAFLLPEEQIKEELIKIERKTNPDAYLDLKEKWQVSIQVLGYRAMHLGILTKREHRNFYVTLHRRNYLKEEPLDLIIAIQRPQKIKSIFNLVVEKSIIDFKRMLDTDWRVDIEFLYKLTGIDLDFFKNYLTEQKDLQENFVQSISFK